MTPRTRRIAEPVVVVAVALLLSFTGLFERDLWTPDEPREAEIGREMFLNGLSPLPTLGGEPFLEKPPLHPWLMALSFRLFGVSDGVARIPAALGGFAALLVAWQLGRRIGGARTGALSMLALATGAGFVQVSHKAVNDSLLTAFVAVGHLAFFVARDRRDAARTWPWFALAGVCAGLAFLTKGVIGPVLLAGPPLLAVAALREWRFLGRALAQIAAWSALFVALLGLPWILSLAHTAGWDAVSECLVRNTLGRALDDSERFGASGHAQSAFYYLVVFPMVTLPWSLALPSMLGSGRFWRGGGGRRLEFTGWLVLAAVVLLSLPAAKRELYLAPILPAAAAVVGAWLARADAQPGARFDRATLASLFGLCALAALGIAGGGLLLVFAPRAFRALEPLAENGSRAGLALLALAGAAGAAWLGRSAWRTAKRAEPRAATKLTAAAFAVVLALHAVLLPLVDPLKSMRRGALEIAALVPGSGPILALVPDETTRAVVPFYGARLLARAGSWSEARERLAALDPPFLLVPDRAEKRIPDEARRELAVVADVRLSATRNVRLYRRSPAAASDGPGR